MTLLLGSLRTVQTCRTAPGVSKAWRFAAVECLRGACPKHEHMHLQLHWQLLAPSQCALVCTSVLLHVPVPALLHACFVRLPFADPDTWRTSRLHPCGTPAAGQQYMREVGALGRLKMVHQSLSLTQQQHKPAGKLCNATCSDVNITKYWIAGWLRYWYKHAHASHQCLACLCSPPHPRD
jgi:hypothetical protein